jgi:hypothetical protein
MALDIKIVRARLDALKKPPTYRQRKAWEKLPKLTEEEKDKQVKEMVEEMFAHEQ